MEKRKQKDKVTCYLPSELHRELRIRAVLEEQPMSALIEQALYYMLEHPEEVEAAHGHTHRVYHCPECEVPVVMRSDRLETLPRTKAVLTEPVSGSQEREELVSLVS